MKRVFFLGSFSLFVTFAFAAAPVLQWVRPHPDLLSYEVNRIHQVLDSDGNLYLAARNSTDAFSDMALAKYDPSGTLLWHRYFDNGAYGYDEPLAVGLDLEGSVYMAGYGGFPRDFAVAKYSPGGDLLWSRHFGWSNDSDDIPRSAAVDPWGTVCMGGSGQFTSGSGRLEGALLVSWNRQGERVLEDIFPQYSFCDSVVVDTEGRPSFGIRFPWSGTVEINGYHYAGSGPIVQHVDADNNVLAAFSRNADLILVKFNPTGTESWVREQPQGDSSDIALRSDSRGAILVMESHDQDDGTFTRLTKYSADGALHWTTTIPDAFTSVEALAVTRRGDILIAPIYRQNDWASRIIGLDARGRTRWNIPAASGQVVAALAVDDRGNFYTSGHGLVARYSARK